MVRSGGDRRRRRIENGVHVATASVGVQVQILGLLTGNRANSPSPVSFDAASGVFEVRDFASGDNVLTLPANATALLIAFPTDNLEGVLLEGVTELARASWSFLNFGPDAPPASVTIESTGDIEGVELLWL